MLPVYHYLCTGYSPVNLFFLEDQVNQGDQEDPKSERKMDREMKKGMLRERRGKRRESMLMASNNMQFTY